jgi:hypothetical protein
MKMKKTLLSLLAVAVLLVAAGAQLINGERKPLVAVSFSGYDKLVRDIDAVGSLSDNADLGKGLDFILQMMTGGKGLAGVDTKRPWGAVVLVDGQQFIPYGFIPVTDLKQLFELTKDKPALEEKVKLEKDVYAVEVKEGQTVYVQQKGKWAFVTDKKENLATLPEKPLDIIGDLPQKYDLAVRVFAQNVPKSYRDQFMSQLQVGADAGLPQQPNESDSQYALRQKAAEQAVQQTIALVNDLEYLTIGLNIESKTARTYLDVELTAVDGSTLAKQLGAWKPTKTNFAGMLAPEAVLASNWAGTISDADVARAKTGLAEVRKTAQDQLENGGVAGDDLKSLMKLVDGVVAVLEKTVESKKSDGGATLFASPDALTLVGGLAIAGGDDLEKVFKDVADNFKTQAAAESVEVKLDSDSYQGVRFHAITVPAKDENMQKLVGKKLEIVLGIADDRLLVAAGRDAAKTLKKTIDRLKADAGKDALPIKLTSSVASLVKFAVANEQDEASKAQLLAAAKLLEKAGGKDHVILTLNAVPRGARLRLELEEGLVKVIGQMSQAAGGPGGVPPVTDSFDIEPKAAKPKPR